MVLLPKLPEVGALPKGWPPLGPTLSTHSKIYSGKVLSFQELEQLRTDATLAAEMEVNDPDFKRATARYRAQCAEEDRIVDTQRAIEERSKAVEGVRTRIKMQQQAAKAYGSQKRERKAQRIKEAMAARDEKRNALVERITTNDRRQLVRDTIQKALVAQRYAENVSGAARAACHRGALARRERGQLVLTGAGLLGGALEGKVHLGLDNMLGDRATLPGRLRDLVRPRSWHLLHLGALPSTLDVQAAHRD